MPAKPSLNKKISKPAVGTLYKKSTLKRRFKSYRKINYFTVTNILKEVIIYHLTKTNFIRRPGFVPGFFILLLIILQLFFFLKPRTMFLISMYLTEVFHGGIVVSLTSTSYHWGSLITLYIKHNRFSPLLVPHSFNNNTSTMPCSVVVVLSLPKYHQGHIPQP